jgi:RNA polymerase sigma factor (sigma-70 family)
MSTGDSYEDAVADSQLWLALQAGDKLALSTLAEKYYRPLFHYGSKFSPDKDLIKDCIQDLFLTLWEKKEALQGVLSVKPYLFSSFRNNFLKKSRKELKLSDVSENAFYFDEDQIPDKQLIQFETNQQLQDWLHKAIGQLPKRQSEALYLRYYENLSYEEIAGVMGLNRQAVANYLQYAIQKLRNHWQPSLILVALGAVAFFL